MEQRLPPKLPLELWHTVYGLLAATAFSFSRPGYIDALVVDSKSLAALCRTSRDLYQIGVPYLYRAVDVRSQSFIPLAKTVLARPDLGALVQYLYIHDDGLTHPTPDSNHALEQLSPYFEYVAGIPPYGSGSGLEPVNLVPLILKQTACFEWLGISARWSVTLELPRSSITWLKQLRCETMQQHWVGGNFKQALQIAPNLRSLQISNGIIDGLHIYPTILSLELFDDKIRGSNNALDYAAVCVYLQHFTWYIPSFRWGDDPFQYMFNALHRHYSTLQSLRLEPSFMIRRNNNTQQLASIEKFTALEEFFVSTRYFVCRDRDGETLILDLLEKLPQSLRILHILKEHATADENILSLARAHSQGKYPRLKELGLRIPQSMLPGDIPGLAAACKDGGLRLTITTVHDIVADNGAPVP